MEKKYLHDASHMTKIGATPIYVKKNTLKTLHDQWTDFNEILYVEFCTSARHNLFKQIPWTDFDLFMARSNCSTQPGFVCFGLYQT